MPPKWNSGYATDWRIQLVMMKPTTWMQFSKHRPKMIA